MKFSEILEVILFRDVLSYIFPGSILFVFVILSYFDTMSVILNNIQSLFGYNVYIILCGIFSYVIGYSTSTLGFFLKDIIDHILSWVWKKDYNKNQSSYIKILENNGFQYGSYKELAQACLYNLQSRFPEIYKEKIEKRIALRNFELNLVVTFLIILFLVGNLKFHHLIYGGMSLSCILLLFGCFRLDREINYLIPIQTLASLINKIDDKS